MACPNRAADTRGGSVSFTIYRPRAGSPRATPLAPMDTRGPMSELLLDRDRPLARTAGRTGDGTRARSGQVELGEEVVLVGQIGHFQGDVQILGLIAPREPGVGQGVTRYLSIDGGRRTERRREIAACQATLIGDIETRRERTGAAQANLILTAGAPFRFDEPDGSRAEQADDRRIARTTRERSQFNGIRSHY